VRQPLADQPRRHVRREHAERGAGDYPEERIVPGGARDHRELRLAGSASATSSAETMKSSIWTGRQPMPVCGKTGDAKCAQQSAGVA